MGEDCGLGEERQGQNDFGFAILDFRLGINRQIDFGFAILDFRLGINRQIDFGFVILDFGLI